MTRLALALALSLAACGDDGGGGGDAGLDAIRQLALTVEGNLSMPTYTVKVTIEANGTTRIYTYPVGGLPATVDMPAPIQLGTWNIMVDAQSMTSAIIGRGTTSIPSGTSAATVTVTPVP